MDKFEMKTNKKLLAAFTVLVMAFCAFAVLAPASDADPAMDVLEGMYVEGEIEFDPSSNQYKLNKDATITLPTDRAVVLNQMQFTGDYVLTITGGGGKIFWVNYDFSNASNSKMTIFDVKEVKLQDAYLRVDVKSGKTVASGDDHNILGNTNLTVTGDSQAMFTTDIGSSRISLNECVMTITGPKAVVHFAGAVSFGANLIMRDGAKLIISNPHVTAGNIYADIENSSIEVTGASGNHALNIYGAKTNGSSEAAVIKNSTITTDGILGLYGSTHGINAEGSTFNADSMYVVRSTDANPLTTKLVGADINVAKIGAPRTNAYAVITDYSNTKLTFDGVTVIGETAVDPNSNLSTDGNGIAFEDTGKLILDQPMYGMEYTDGTKVIIGGNEYTVYHYKSGDVKIQYGISCGDVYYTGEVLTKKNVHIIAISLTEGFNATNVSYELQYDGIIKDAGTYTDALAIQITFSGSVAVTSNLETDLIIKPAPLDIRFGVPDEYNGIPVGDFQKIQIGADGNIVGKVGYYNLADGMDGYYLVITAQVYDKEDNLVPDVQISTEGMVPVGDGKYMLFLGKTFDEARQKLDSRIGFTAEYGPNYIVPESWIDLGGIQPVDVMSIRAMKFQNILGAYFEELYDTLDFAAKNDPTQFEVTGKLLWKANYTGFSSDFNETRGWYIPFQMYNNDTNADFWKNSTADIQILKLKENVELDGEFVFRIVDINVDPVITLKDPNGFKTRYVLDISGIEFGSATGYGETKAEAEENMSWEGIEPEKLTENGSDVIDKTMFMIFNTSAYRGQKVIATATNITDGMKTSYSEEIQIGEDQNICIWYFSFNDQFKDQNPGVYELEVKAGDNPVAKAKEAMKGVRIFTSGFEEKAEDAKREINAYRPDIEDVADKTFYMIAGIYGYPLGTKITASMLNSNELDIIMNPGTIGVNAISLSGPCDEWKYAFYFSFDNGDQVTPLDNIYGLYDMRLMNGNDVIAKEQIKVAAKSWLEFSPYDRYNEHSDVGTDLALVQSQTDPTKISLTGKLNCGYEGNYYFAVTWNDISNEHPNAVIKSKALYTGHETIENRFTVFGFTPNVDRAYEITVDFDGDESGYEPTTYTFTFDGTYNPRLVDVYLIDDLYAGGELKYKSKGQLVDNPSFLLPNGPNGSKEFIGWKAENGKIYTGLSYIEISNDLNAIYDDRADFVAVYKGSMQRDSYKMEASVLDTDKGSVLTIRTDSEQVEDYRNLSANHYYLIAMFDADGKSVMSKAIASPRILNGGDVYSESVDIELPVKFGLGYSILIDFKTDYAMGMIEICESVILEKTVASDSGFVADAAEACEAINEALAKHGRDHGVDADDVDSNTAYTVFDTTDEMNGKTLTAYLYKGNEIVYAETMTFGTSGAHVWYYSFNNAAPSHTEGGNVLIPMAEGTEPYGEYTVFILDEDGHNVVESKFTA